MRRKFLTFLLASGLGTTALSQPSKLGSIKALKIVVGFPAGTQPDILARLYGDQLAKTLGTAVLIDNKTGVAGNIGSDAVAKSAGDGTTLLYAPSNVLSLSPHLYSKMPFDATKDLIPVASTIKQSLVLVANNSLQISNVLELVTFAKKKQLKYGSYGLGSYSHLVMEMLSSAAQVQMVHVPYRTGPMNDLIGGEIDLLIEPPSTAMSFVNSKKVVAIANTGSARNSALPNLPSLAETYPSVAADAWHGFWAPKGTSPDIIKQFYALISDANKLADVSKHVADLYCQPFTLRPEEMTARLAQDSAIWGAIVKEKNIRLD